MKIRKLGLMAESKICSKKRMKISVIMLLLVCVLVLGLGTHCTLGKPGIIGTWVIDQTYQMYTDPPDTVSMTQNITIIMNTDGTCTYSGTSILDAAPQNTIEGSGTYTYDEEAGTLEFIYETTLVDGVQMDLTMPTYDCVITETTMTLTVPTVQPNTPAEPLIYTRQ